MRQSPRSSDKENQKHSERGGASHPAFTRKERLLVAAQNKEYPAEVVRGTFFEHDLPITNMFVHFRTQPGGYARPLREHRVRKLVAEWDRQAVGVLLLSMRDDGTMAVIDGQHRIEAASRVGVSHLDAMVYIDLTLEDEARLYRKFGDYLKQTALDRFHAGLTEGLEDYKKIQDLLAGFKLSIPFNLNVHSHTVVAVDALLKVKTVYGIDSLWETIALLHDAWEGNQRAYRSGLLLGTAAFIARFAQHPNYTRKRLLQRMKKEGLGSIERRSLSLREGSLATNPHAAWGQALLSLHDYRLPPGTELGEWPKRHITEQAAASLAANLARVNAAMTPEQRSARSQKGQDSLTPEQKTDRAVRAAATRFGVPPRKVVCPVCNALPNTPCRTSNNRVAKNSHEGRKALAKEQRQQWTRPTTNPTSP